MKSEQMSFQSSVFRFQRGGFCPPSFIHFLLLFWLSAASPLDAAPPPKEIPAFELSAIRLGDFEIPPLFYLDVKTGLDGKDLRTYHPLSAPNGSRSPAFKVSLVPPVRIFTGTFDAKGKPDMQSYLGIPATTPKDRLLLVFFLDKQGKPQRMVLDDSAAAHPAGSVRTVNLGTGRVAFSAGGANRIVPPGGEAKTLPAVKSDGRFPFILFLEPPGDKPYQSPTKLFRFRLPGSRLLVFHTILQVDLPTGERRPDGTEITNKVYVPTTYPLADTVDASATQIAEPAASTAKTVQPPAPQEQEQELDIIAPGSQIPEGEEIEFSWDGEVPPGRTAIRPGEIVRMRAPISRSATLQFAKGNPIGTATFGSMSRQNLVVLVPGTDATDPVSVLAFENSVLSHPLGGARLFNLTPYQLSYSVGKEIGYVTPKEAAALAFPSGESTIRLAVKAAAGWKMVSEARPAKPDADKRNAIFVYKLPGKEEFRVLEVAL